MPGRRRVSRDPELALALATLKETRGPEARARHARGVLRTAMKDHPAWEEGDVITCGDLSATVVRRIGNGHTVAPYNRLALQPMRSSGEGKSQ